VSDRHFGILHLGIPIFGNLTVGGPIFGDFITMPQFCLQLDFIMGRVLHIHKCYLGLLRLVPIIRESICVSLSSWILEVNM
jgi:hypothetical protein